MKPIFSIIVLCLFILFAGCEKDSITPAYENQSVGQISAMPVLESKIFDGGDKPGLVRVMTRNIYVGADVEPILTAEDPAQIPVLVAEAFQGLLSTNFPERAQSLANEIEMTHPHLIGLQEVSLIRTQSPGDAVIGGTVPAEDVLFNYLDILMAALAEKGLNYYVAGLIQNADVEVPMLVNTDPQEFDDVRLTDFDVILARHDVETANLLAANYQARLPVESLGTEIPRGYVIVDANVNGNQYRFANTHLEVVPVQEALIIQLAQARELVNVLRNENKPVIAVGDFNSSAPDGPTYLFMLANRYVDTWLLNVLKDNPEGYTCCHDPDLRNEESGLDHRIDFVFVKNPDRLFIKPVKAMVVGDEQDNRTPSGLWPSDHGGVVAQWLNIESRFFSLQ